jgi:tetratricopeptide (TPR) repeat protein
MKKLSAGILSILLSFSIFTSKLKAADLGTVSFPISSTSEEAQKRFLIGLAALHSFWYDRALEEFRAATAADQEFAMGYWGEAMTFNHPIWGTQPEKEEGRKALAKIKENFKISKYEQAYIDATRILFGEGEKIARNKAYLQAMGKIYKDYPNDNEAASFYALAILGALDPLESNIRERMQAANIVLEVFKRAPNHPGAAHYVIHSLDDPDHAILALPAAQHYAKIAPDAFHALHMPSHIFLQLGMWPEVTASNQTAWTSSLTWSSAKHLPTIDRDFHSLHWLLYSYLQQGRYAKAEETLHLMHQNLAEFRSEDKGHPLGIMSHGSMTAAFIVETERWDSSEQQETFTEKDKHKGSTVMSKVHCQIGYGVDNSAAIFTRGLSLAKQGLPEANKSVEALRTMRKNFNARTIFDEKILEIQELEIIASELASKKRFDKAIQIMQKATNIEESLPAPSGPPELIKPSHELFGEILLMAKRPKESAAQFAISLYRHPNRARSLLGAARSADAMGDRQIASKHYSQLMQQWELADPNLKEKHEATAYLTKHAVSASL